MAKTIRPTYPKEYSIGLLLIIFSLAGFLSYQIFEKSGHSIDEIENVYLGMFLVSSAVIIMLLVLWEELLFPVKVKPEDGGVVFRNHRSKLKTQLLIYCSIPIIFGFIYFNFEVNLTPFLIWAAVCIVLPIAGKLISGIKNYNDFLKLTDDAIEYRNNQKTGIFKLTDVSQIILIKDERNVLHKIQLSLINNQTVVIDLDEMEIEAFYATIDRFITTHHANLLTGTTVVSSS